MRVANFSQTPSREPRRLFSARVARKFFRMSPLSAPATFWSSAMICCLSALVRVGAPRIAPSFLSACRVWPRLAIALAVWSRAADLEEAVY